MKNTSFWLFFGDETVYYKATNPVTPVTSMRNLCMYHHSSFVVFLIKRHYCCVSIAFLSLLADCHVFFLHNVDFHFSSRFNLLLNFVQVYSGGLVAKKKRNSRGQTRKRIERKKQKQQKTRMEWTSYRNTKKKRKEKKKKKLTQQTFWHFALSADVNQCTDYSWN